MTQWTGEEQKAVARVLLPVITPLLLKAAPDAIFFTRALLDFMTIAYMEDVLKRIFWTKEAYTRERQKEVRQEAHWNYSKFHAISHYADFIGRFGAPVGYNNDMFEAGDKHFLKAFYDRTNRNTRLSRIERQRQKGSMRTLMTRRNTKNLNAGQTSKMKAYWTWD